MKKIIVLHCKSIQIPMIDEFMSPTRESTTIPFLSQYNF